MKKEDICVEMCMCLPHKIFVSLLKTNSKARQIYVSFQKSTIP